MAAKTKVFPLGNNFYKVQIAAFDDAYVEFDMPCVYKIWSFNFGLPPGRNGISPNNNSFQNVVIKWYSTDDNNSSATLIKTANDSSSLEPSTASYEGEFVFGDLNNRTITVYNVPEGQTRDTLEGWIIYQDLSKSGCGCKKCSGSKK